MTSCFGTGQLPLGQCTLNSFLLYLWLRGGIYLGLFFWDLGGVGERRNTLRYYDLRWSLFLTALCK